MSEWKNTSDSQWISSDDSQWVDTNDTSINAFVSDGLLVEDTSIKNVAFNAGVIDSMKASDVDSKLTDFVSQITKVVQLSDSSLGGDVIDATLMDNIQLSDDGLIWKVYLKYVTSTLVGSDSTDFTYSALGKADEKVSFIDLLRASKNVEALCEDGSQLIDRVIFKDMLSDALVDEGILVSDETLWFIIQPALREDGIVLNDFVNHLTIYNAYVSDVIELSVAISRILRIAAQVDDSIELKDLYLTILEKVLAHGKANVELEAYGLTVKMSVMYQRTEAE